MFFKKKPRFATRRDNGGQDLRKAAPVKSDDRPRETRLRFGHGEM